MKISFCINIFPKKDALVNCGLVGKIHFLKLHIITALHLPPATLLVF